MRRDTSTSRCDDGGVSSEGRGTSPFGVRPTDSEHRPTMFELLFDLVYVFAATQVTAFMADEH